MVEQNQIKQQIIQWVEKKATGKNLSVIKSDTPILEQKYINSLDIMDLIIFIEDLSGIPVEEHQLKPDSFKSVDAIYQNFFAGK
jgi:acyl carrier protein